MELTFTFQEKILKIYSLCRKISINKNTKESKRKSHNALDEQLFVWIRSRKENNAYVLFIPLIIPTYVRDSKFATLQVNVIQHVYTEYII